MRKKRYISVIMAFLTMGTNLVSLCPAGQGNIVEIHLTVVPCTSHDCHRTHEQHSCEQKECNHGLCNDIPALEACNITQQNQFVSYATLVSGVVADAVLPVDPVQIARSFFDLHVPFPHVSTPLRI
jgi:hypothetical protein